MRISLFSQSLFALDLDRAIRATAEAGYTAVELACAEPHFDQETARIRPGEVAEAIERAGLAVSALSLFSGFTDRRSLDRQIEAAAAFICLAPAFRTGVVKVTPGPPGSADAVDEHWELLARGLRDLVPVAEESGVTLAVETHMRQLTDTLASARRLLDLVSSDVVGLTLDFLNLAFAGETMEQVIDELAGRVLHTHVKNGTIGAQGTWHFGPLDEGLLDYVEVVALLRGAGYAGYLSVECLGPDARTAPVETARRDRIILERCLGAALE